MLNIYNYIILTTPSLVKFDVELQEIAEKWDIDWCTFEEFKLHVWHIWTLNTDSFKPHGMNFQRFFNMQMILLRETPIYFKFAMKKVKQDNLDWLLGDKHTPYPTYL